MALLLCFVALIFFASCEQPTAQKVHLPEWEPNAGATAEEPGSGAPQEGTGGPPEIPRGYDA
jgi:hypothetical protein